jgi:alkylation response protein AidB-like acyl-CoA dehydrogenase
MYRAPLKDLNFVLEHVLQTGSLAKLPRHAEYSTELAASVLQEAARFAENVLEPLNKTGDREGARWTPDGVVTPAGFKAAYQQFAADGWAALRADPEFGGQGVPAVLGTAVEEIWGSANMAFKLCPMLTQGAIEALHHKGSEAQKQTYLPKMVSGEWTGTMNLTEPQAGSDLGQIRTRAVADGDRYRLFGQKIFITYGDHDYTANTIHMVLARIDGAPAGVRGISLFIVPKFLVNADGSIGARNDAHCISIEHKMGIHASPTCVMAYGQKDGAIGYLVGEANRGLEYMFVMMNAARLAVGVEGWSTGERAYQQALDWARTRVQGKPSSPTPVGSTGPLPIAFHPDVRRMLLSMRALVEAMRALGLLAALNQDLAQGHPDPAVQARHQARLDLLIPIVKGWSTDNGVLIASTGVQVHGGMGYIEETGAAQILRDSQISTIYEGTTGIQANDLIGRKIARDRGAAISALLDEFQQELSAQALAGAEIIQQAALEGIASLRASTAAMLDLLATDPAAAQAVAVPYLKLCGTVLGGCLMARSARIAVTLRGQSGADQGWCDAKLQTARFYGEQIMPQATLYATLVRSGSGSVLAADPALF